MILIVQVKTQNMAVVMYLLCVLLKCIWFVPKLMDVRVITRQQLMILMH